ncbi:MAG: hypothetical protein WBQ74_01475 [Candidatus Sulfotelmatobacter sp.]|jgi:hypothetical protein
MKTSSHGKPPVPRLRAGESHTLRAELKKEELKIFIDNREVWDGNVGSHAAGLGGPVGIRSDNAATRIRSQGWRI